MKQLFFLLHILLIPCSFTYGQVESIELMPEIINKTGTINTQPSFNQQQNKLCFYRETKRERAIMISEKSPDGTWSEPYVAIPFPYKSSKGFLAGARINAAGTRIY